MAKTKWMVSLTEAQYTWIKDTANKASVSGASVLRTLIDQAMEQPPVDFKKDFVEAQARAKLKALEDKIASLTAEERELRIKLNGKARVAV